VDLSVCLSEDYDSLFGPTPYECTTKSTDSLDLALFQRHIARISDLVNDLKAAFDAYQYAISWRNPLLTAVSLVFFIHASRHYDPAVLVVTLLILYMVKAACTRLLRAKQKHKFVRRETVMLQKGDKLTLDYSLHRPLSEVTVKVLKARNITSPEFGLRGQVYCQVSYESERFTSSDGDSKTATSQSPWVEVGRTNTVFSSSPTFETHGTESTRRLRQLLVLEETHGDNDVSKLDVDACMFPVLQPFVKEYGNMKSLVPWSDGTAAIVVDVRFVEVLSVLPGSEYAIGTVVIPVADIEHQRNIKGWFKINTEDGSTLREVHVDDGSPQAYIEVSWKAPSTSSEEATEKERELSALVQEEISRLEAESKHEKKGFLLGSIGAINRVRGLTGTLVVIQNTLGTTLDGIESARNLINFTVRMHVSSKAILTVTKGSSQINCYNCRTFCVADLLLPLATSFDRPFWWVGSVCLHFLAEIWLVAQEKQESQNQEGRKPDCNLVDERLLWHSQ